MENGFKHMHASPMAITPGYVSKEPKKSRDWLVNLLIIVIPILLCFILIMIFMFAVDMPPKEPYTSICLASEESNRSDLADVLRRVRLLYFYELHPEMVYQLHGVTPEDIRRYFRPYDPTPNATKNRTDKAMKLREELNALKVNTTLLKLRERKAIHVADAILMNNFGWAPYTQDYYNGDWLLGPDFYCWQPVCSVFQHLNGAFSHFKPRNITELEKLKELFEMYNRTFNRYIENWKLGARTGYVRTYAACKAGLHAIKYENYRGMALKNESGIYDEPFAKVLLHSGFFEDLSKSANDTWLELYQTNVTAYFSHSLIQDIARAAVKMLKYLENEYLLHCPKDENIASGLGKLPLNFIFYDDIADTSQPATHTLPTGEVLSGDKTYQTLMRYFTTMDITPEDLRKKAVTRRDKLYKQALILAKSYTGELNNEALAISEFKDVLAHTDMSFNSNPFPINESGDLAFVKCNNPENAKAYCPQRWKALQAWINNTFYTMKNDIDPVIKPLFYYDGAKKTVPTCPIDCVASFSPYANFHSYNPGNKDCTTKATQGLPFFVNRFGPKWTEYTTTAHEQLPGHHLEVQSFIEYFEDDCTDAIHWMSAANFFAAMTEGWATYIEYELLPDDTKIYSNTLDKEVLLQKYGMIYYQLLAAIRAIVDIDLNFYTKSESQAESIYRQYLWPENADFINKEITRIQSAPGLLTSYLIGQIEISRVRDIAERELGRDFDLKEFHYEVLRQGEYPLPYLEEHIRAYIACKKDPTRVGCKEF